MRKKAQVEFVILFIAILFIVLFVGFAMATGSAIINWVWDEAYPEVSTLGTVGDANMTDIASYTVYPLNLIIQNFRWLIGIIYMMMLVACIVFVFMMKINPSRWLIGFYFGLIIILVIGCIFISNIYEDFYDGTDALATRLKEETILSWMILYSPFIMLVIAVIGGIIMFSGISEGTEFI